MLAIRRSCGVPGKARKKRKVSGSWTVAEEVGETLTKLVNNGAWPIYGGQGVFVSS